MNSLPMFKYTSACCGANYVCYVVCSKIDIPRTAVSRLSNRLVLLDSEHRFKILEQVNSYELR